MPTGLVPMAPTTALPHTLTAGQQYLDYAANATFANGYPAAAAAASASLDQYAAVSAGKSKMKEKEWKYMTQEIDKSWIGEECCITAIINAGTNLCWSYVGYYMTMNYNE